jgi:peptidoglycan/LPS O-acetylase OafA/YrhL
MINAAPRLQTLPSSSQSPGHIELIDLLRIFAVLAVVMFHYGYRGAAADGFTDVHLPQGADVLKYGYFGVQLFFVISGFVIAYSAGDRSFTEFAIARIARIYPGFVACMTATFLVTIALGAPRFQATASQWLANLAIVAPAFKQAFMDGAYWSIVYEIVFYGWIGILIATRLFKRSIENVLVIWLAVSVINEAVLHSSALRYLLLTDQSGFFAAGVLLYRIHSRQADFASFIGLVFAAATGALQAIIGLEPLRVRFAIPYDDAVAGALSIGCVAAVALTLVVKRIPLPSRLLVAGGAITYPFYLLHQHIGFIVFSHIQYRAHPELIIGGMIVAVTILSWLVWRCVEKPAQRALKLFLRSLSDKVQKGFRARSGSPLSAMPGEPIAAKSQLRRPLRSGYSAAAESQVRPPAFINQSSDPACRSEP